MKKKRRAREPAALPAPSPSAWNALGPYARGRLEEKARGFPTLSLDVPWDVFSSQAIDEGTLLLLRNLPAGEPRSVLDLGCGYGALGLPIAARWPSSRCVLIDRDLLAVAAAAHNARMLGLRNAEARPGLGYREMAGESFDWVVCNVPARIGPRAIRYLLEGGRALGAEVRAVVIRDLRGVVRDLDLPGLRHLAPGARHDVFALPRGPAAIDLGDEGIYARDETEFAGLRLSRPHDASEDPEHSVLLSALAESLPRTAPARALAFRAGYGALPLHLKSRYPASRVLAQERDLLDAAFVRRNARNLALPIEVRETLFPADGLEPGSFSLVVGELSSPAGPLVAARELQDSADLLAAGGEALIVATEKQERDWFPGAAPKKAALTLLLRRQGASVLRISRPRAA
ncbi:MAG: methyltransferase [Deltaproteobacteria bacterium]|nr:MAG: methyltransferase [Deltaproteobacteria bacterium]